MHGSVFDTGQLDSDEQYMYFDPLHAEFPQ